jgi:HAD superfamily hydrolase (TIGR01549 family)
MNIKNKDSLRIPPHEYEVIIWDFDGVIKESVAVKIDGFSKLFAEYGNDILEKVIKHNLLNTGISRYEKIPFYFKEYLGVELTQSEIELYCRRLSDLTNEAVVHSPWVAGVRDFLQCGYEKQKYYIATGTPQKDIEWIVDELNIRNMFHGIYGSPMAKVDILSKIMKANDCSSENYLMIGDAMIDLEAARENGIDFLLRSTSVNDMHFTGIVCPKFNDFEELNESS